MDISENVCKTCLKEQELAPNTGKPLEKYCNL